MSEESRAVTTTEPMPSLVAGNTELDGGKLKKGKGFLKPNFEPGPNPVFGWQPKCVRYDGGCVGLSE